MIAYASRATNINESNYSASKVELLAMLYGCEHFKPYLLGRKFLLVTDHRALLWLVNTPTPPATLVRWLLKLSEFDFRVEHRPDKLHNNVDALSRPLFVSRTHAVNLINTVEHIASKYALISNAENTSLNKEISVNFVEHIAL